jgi:hypothetical protein
MTEEKNRGAVSPNAPRKASTGSSVVAGGPGVKKRRPELSRREHDRFCAIQTIVEHETLKANASPEFERGVKAFSYMMWTIKGEPLEKLQDWASRLRGPSKNPRVRAIMGRLSPRGRGK